MLNIFNKTKKKKVNSYNGLQTKFSDCAFKTKKKKKKDKQCITKKFIAKIKQNFFKWHFFFKVN